MIASLRERVASLCSNPACRAWTTGPHAERGKSTIVGEAAHIAAAAPGGARFDDDMTDGERSSFDNAIWVCCNCSKEIDRNETKYPSAILQSWKADAEEEAKKRLRTSACAALAVASDPWGVFTTQ